MHAPWSNPHRLPYFPSSIIPGILPGKTLPMAPPYPARAPALKGCVPPNNTHPFCDTTKTASERATLLAAMFTPTELAMLMNDEMAAVDRLGVRNVMHAGVLRARAPRVCIDFEITDDGRCMTALSCGTLRNIMGTKHMNARTHTHTRMHSHAHILTHAHTRTPKNTVHTVGPGVPVWPRVVARAPARVHCQRGVGEGRPLLHPVPC